MPQSAERTPPESSFRKRRVVDFIDNGYKDRRIIFRAIKEVDGERWKIEISKDYARVYVTCFEPRTHSEQEVDIHLK